MNKKTKNTTGLFLVFLFTCLSISPVLAQDNPKTQSDIFRGKWQGNIQFEVKFFDYQGKIDAHHTSSLNNITFIADEFDDERASSVETLKSFGFDSQTAERFAKTRNEFNGIAKFTGVSQFYNYKGVYDTWKLINGKENIEISGNFFSNNRIWITSNSTVKVVGTATADVGEIEAFSFSAVPLAVAILEGFEFTIKDTIKNNSLVINYKGKPVAADAENEKNYIKITGELRRIHTIKDTLGKTVSVDEPIKTDKYTQKDIVIPEVGEVEVKPESECKFKSKNEIEHFKGKLRHKVRKMKKDGANFEILLPQAVCGVRGTEFITNVGKNSTTLKVFEGEVAFSDINNKKTVIVKKNQMSTVKAGGVPSEPKKMDLASKWFSVH